MVTKQISIVMTSASDIIRLRCLLGALSLSGSTFFANSFSSSLQKSSAMQKISVILSLLIISNLFFCFTIKLLIINVLAKGKTNYFSSFYPIFYAILIPNSRYIVEYVAIGKFYEFTICFLESRYFIRI